MHLMQTDAWEKEYKDPKFLTKHDRPQKDVLRFIKFLKKNSVDFSLSKVLDLGTGTGRNANFFATLGCDVYGLDISKTAISLAKDRAKSDGLDVKYFLKNIGSKLDFQDNFFDICLDVTSSNSLNYEERGIYMSECNRVLKKGAFFLLKALCLESDKNAKNLLKQSPAKEKNSYFIKEIGLTEKVWERNELINFYGKNFDFLYLERKSSYLYMIDRFYKRNFWIAYLRNR